MDGKHKDTKNKYDTNGFDINGKHKGTGAFLDKKNDIRKDISKIKGKIRTDQARSFKDQKGKGYIDLPIILSKLNINSSKELRSNIKQLINNLYDNEQITKKVYNNLIKAITYKK